MKTGFIFLALLALPIPALAQDMKACIAASESAQKLRDEHKLLKAREQFLLCAKDACPGAIRQDCADSLGTLSKKIPSIVVRAKDKNGADAVQVALSIDGARISETLDGKALPIDPGVHQFKLEMAGETPLEKQVVIAEGEQNRAIDFSFTAPVVSAPPPPAVVEKKRGFPVAATIVAGVGVAAFASFAIFGLMGTSEFNDAKKTCGPPMGGCPNDKIDSIRTKLIVADVSLVAGIAGVATATILYILHFSGGSPEKASVGVAPVAGGVYGSFGMRF